MMPVLFAAKSATTRSLCMVVNIILLFASAYLISIGHAGVFYVAVVLLVLFYIALS